MRKLLAEYLKTERLIKRMDHVDVCNVSGVSQSTMTRIENSHGNVTLENILAVLQTYELDEPLRVYLTKEIEVGKRILAQRNK
jgi:transcriptional regulator with XRE-family HTH domain